MVSLNKAGVFSGPALGFPRGIGGSGPLDSHDIRDDDLSDPRPYW